jgi:ABC-type cobalamin/Fe3+-siderophores transport system ATPase subunit
MRSLCDGDDHRPKQSLDIVREIHHVRSEERPYVIVFCGVNGVGKSTSLAKVCNWLLGNNMKVLIAACDTFRAGAGAAAPVFCFGGGGVTWCSLLFFRRLLRTPAPPKTVAHQLP